MNKRRDSDHGIFAESTLSTFASLSVDSANTARHDTESFVMARGVRLAMTWRNRGNDGLSN